MYNFVITFEKYSGPTVHNDVIIFGQHPEITLNDMSVIQAGYMTVEEAGQLMGGN
jgi:hypothetical protein